MSLGATPPLIIAIAEAGVLTTLITAIVYVRFSVRLMPALAKLSASQGISRMQQFNRTAVKPPFMTAFFGAAAVGLLFLVVWVRGDHALGITLAAVGGLAYLAGFVLTIAFHVPRNGASAALDPSATSSAPPWSVYLREWTGGNTVRAVLSSVAASAFAAGVIALLTGG